MSEIPADLRYASSHEWVKDNEDGTVTVGITDHAQGLLGDLVFVELPELDAEFGAEDAIAVAESVKAASDVYAPVSGVVTEVNASLEDEPELINGSPYDDGWLFTLKVSDASELENLMDAEAYTDHSAE